MLFWYFLIAIIFYVLSVVYVATLNYKYGITMIPHWSLILSAILWPVTIGITILYAIFA